LVVIFDGEANEDIDGELVGIEELEYALNDMSSGLYIKESECLDVVLVELGTDSVEVAKKLRESPTKIISRVIPINKVVESRLESIIQEIKELSREISKPGEFFSLKCTVMNNEKIEYPILKKSLLDELDKIGLIYNEKTPNWVVYVEVIGDNTGLSVLSFSEMEDYN
jgi:tRNA acetyltransferase TAN1